MDIGHGHSTNCMYIVTESVQVREEITEMFVTVVITERDPVAQMFESQFQVYTHS